MTFPLWRWVLAGMGGMAVAGLAGDGAAMLWLALFLVVFTIARHRHRADVERAERRRRLRDAAWQRSNDYKSEG